MSTVTIFHNAVDPTDRSITENVDDVCAHLLEHFGTFPDTARIYLGSVAECNNVTPHTEADIERLERLQGNFFVVVWPEDPLTIAIIVAVVVAAVAIGLAFLLKPSTPETGQGSPNNQLSDRQNKARPNERIPDIVGTVRATPDLLVLPYRAFVNNQEFEYIYACVGRQHYTILDCKDGDTPVDWIDGEWTGVYPPFNSPNSADPIIQNQFGFKPSVIPPIVSIQQSNSVNGQQVRAPNAGNFFADNDVAFQYGGIILGNGSGQDFTQYFVASTESVPSYLEIYTNDDGINASDPAGVVGAVGLAGTYLILDVTDNSITLSNAATVNPNWNVLASFEAETSTYYHSFWIDQLGTPVLGPYILNVANMTEVWANFVCPNGLYFIDANGNQKALTVTIQMNVQAVNDALEPIGDIISGSIDVVGQALEQSLVGSTLKMVLPTPGPCQVTVQQLTNMGTDKRNTWVQTVQWRDLYAVSSIAFEIPVAATPGIGEYIKTLLPNCPPGAIVEGNGGGSSVATVEGGSIGFSLSKGGPLYSEVGPLGIYEFPAPDLPADAIITKVIVQGYAQLSGTDCTGAAALPSVSSTAAVGPAFSIPGASTLHAFESIELPIGSSNAEALTAISEASYSFGVTYSLRPPPTPDWPSIFDGPLFNCTFSMSNIIMLVYYTSATPGSTGTGIGVTNGDFGDITTVYGITAQTPDTLSVKERKLNLLVTRNLPTWIDRATTPPAFSTTLYPTNNAADIFCAMALDPYIGRRLLSELDVPGIYGVADSGYMSSQTLIYDGLGKLITDSTGTDLALTNALVNGGEHVDGEIAAYFGSFLMTEFCYTFDDTKISFEESASQIAQAINCIAYRSASTISLSFEKMTENSTMLFNHRNKIPNSESRTFSFGVVNDYDGVQYDYIDPNAPNYPNVDTTLTLYFPLNQSAVNPRKVKSVGVRNLPQAMLNAWRMYQKIIYANAQTKFEATQEATLRILNDRILVADNTRSETQDGELIAVDGMTVTTSQPVTLLEGVTYTAFFQHYDDSVEGIAVTAGETPHTLVLSAAPLLPFVTDESMFARTTYQLVGSTGAPATPFLLTEKEPNSNSTFNLTAINYNNLYYAHDQDIANGVVLPPAYGYGTQGYTGDGLINEEGNAYSPTARTSFDSTAYGASPLSGSNNVSSPTVNPPALPAPTKLIMAGSSDTISAPMQYELSASNPAAPAGTVNASIQSVIDPDTEIEYISISVPGKTKIALAPTDAGNFTIAHGLAYTPSAVLFEMTSGGQFWLQSPLSYDATNLYLVASDSGVTGNAVCYK